jgi:hypothetical protein
MRRRCSAHPGKHPLALALARAGYCCAQSAGPLNLAARPVVSNLCIFSILKALGSPTGSQTGKVKSGWPVLEK